MKKLLSVFMIICLAISIVPCYNISARAVSNFEYDDKTKTLTIYNDASYDKDFWAEYGEKAEKLVIGENVTSLEKAELSYCTNISEIVVEKDNENYVTDSQGLLLSDDETILVMCADAKTVKIPATVTKITEGAFASCTSLESIDVHDDNPEFFSDEFGVLYNKDKTVLIRYPDEREAKSYTIPETVVVIWDSAFEDSDNLTSMIIPDSVITIGESAFEDCDGILTLKLSNNLASIGAYAFLDCTEITELVIPDSVTELGEGAFEDCTGLMTVIIGNGLKVISESAFEDCDEIVNLTLGENVTVIDEYAFYDCHKLTHLVIPDSVVEIGEGAFEDIMNLKSVTFGKNVQVIGESAFEDCDSLKEIVLPESVTTIGKSAFYDCHSLESVVIGKNVISVDAFAFSGCYKLLNFYFTGSQSEWSKVPKEIRDFVTVMQSTVYYNCSPKGESYRFAISNPSRYTIRYKDGIVLHTKDNGMLPEDIEIKWSSSDKNFATEMSADGKHLTIVSKSNGHTTFTVTIYDDNGTAMATDTIIMYSKASFFDKLGGYFRSLLGITTVYDA